MPLLQTILGEKYWAKLSRHIFLVSGRAILNMILMRGGAECRQNGRNFQQNSSRTDTALIICKMRYRLHAITILTYDAHRYATLIRTSLTWLLRLSSAVLKISLLEVSLISPEASSIKRGRTFTSAACLRIDQIDFCSRCATLSFSGKGHHTVELSFLSALASGHSRDFSSTSF